MTSATLKALVEVYGTLVRASWDEPADEDVEPTAPDHEMAELLTSPVSGAVSSTINGTVTGPTTGTDGTKHVYTT